MYVFKKDYVSLRNVSLVGMEKSPIKAIYYCISIFLSKNIKLSPFFILCM